MKKVLSLILVTTFLMTGCKSTTNKEDQPLTKEQVMQKVAETMSQLESGSFVLKTETVTSSENQNMEMNISSNGKFFGKDIMYIKMHLNMFGMEMDMENYTLIKDQTTTMYSTIPGEEGWIKQSVNAVNLSPAMQYALTLEDASAIEDLGMENSLQKYKVVIPKAKANALMGQAAAALDDPIGESGFELTQDVEMIVYIDPKTFELHQVDADFSKSIASTVADASISSFKINIIYSDFNQVKSFEVPNDVLENAKEVDLG